MSLTRDQLIQFIEKPGLMKEQTLADLREITEEFPYFQSARLLYTCNLHAQSNFRFESSLKNCAVYVPDRTILYRLLQPSAAAENRIKQASAGENLAEPTGDLFELSDDVQVASTELQLQTAVKTSLEDTGGMELISFSEGEDADLIERFIRQNPSIQPRPDVPLGFSDPGEEKEEEVTDRDEFITETLSRIYLKQGHYQKAIDSFKRLSLKFPEKSIYFAQQIEEIKKLLKE